MILLLLIVIVSLVLAITGTVRYGFPAGVFSRVILASWVIAVTVFITLVGLQIWGGPVPGEPVRGSFSAHPRTNQ
jgi:hypothetical protein